MSIVTFEFLIFLLISLILYYLVPRKHKWIVLLISSIYFFLKASLLVIILYLLLGVVVSYVGTILIDEKLKSDEQKKVVYIIVLFILVTQLFVLKELNLLPLIGNGIANLFKLNIKLDTINILAPLGVSYYTLSLIGYVTDVYWTTCKPEKNIFKLMLFVCFYPVMICGPIIRYPEIKDDLYNDNSIEWENIYKGFTRIIYGLMKKLVVADNLAGIVSTIFGNYTVYSGLYIVLGVVCYAIQIYCDFSGCMDIVIGAAKMYGITLPENFKSPFFSKTLSEFWRRWHISLGLWGKDYIMYPILKSDGIQNIGKKCKVKFGKKIGKKIPTILSILILWLIIGIWHGASFRYIFAAGILPWIYLTISELCGNLPQVISEKIKIRTDCLSFRVFQSLRTFGLMCFVWLFVCAPDLHSAPKVIINLFNMADLDKLQQLPKISMPIFILMFIVIFVVDYMKYNEIDVLERFRKQNVIFRWISIFTLIIIILLYGYYGPAYNPIDFIYGGF